MRSRDIRAQRRAKQERELAQDLGPEADDESDADDHLDEAWFEQQWGMPQQQGQQR